MSALRRSARGVVADHALAGAIAVIAILLAGCDASRPALNTAPLATSDISALPMSSEFLPSDSSSLASWGGIVGITRLGGPLAGLSAADLARFLEGREEFKEKETAESGLGPVFNETSCASCHINPVGGTNGRLETRFGRSVLGKFDPLAPLGGSLLQDRAIGRVNTEHGAFTYVPEVVPREANVRALRITTPLFGLGLVEAVTDATLLELARFQAQNTPATQGTPNWVTDVGSGALRVGRFGWKAQVATLLEFAGDAYLNEMGITSPQFPEENAPQGNVEALSYNPAPDLNDDGGDVASFAAFITLLGPPPRGPYSYLTEGGSRVFRQIGCADCHTPTLVTGDSPVPALSRRTFHPYSDFLLHDMGRLGDGIVQGQATGSQMRTAPLWGMGGRRVFLHDGSARSAHYAILAHGGQGSESRDRYRRLRLRDLLTLHVFLKSL